MTDKTQHIKTRIEQLEKRKTEGADWCPDKDLELEGLRLLEARENAPTKQESLEYFDWLWLNFKNHFPRGAAITTAQKKAQSIRAALQSLVLYELARLGQEYDAAPPVVDVDKLIAKLQGECLDNICECIGAPKEYNDGKAAMRDFIFKRLAKHLASQGYLTKPLPKPPTKEGN